MNQDDLDALITNVLLRVQDAVRKSRRLSPWKALSRLGTSFQTESAVRNRLDLAYAQLFPETPKLSQGQRLKVVNLALVLRGQSSEKALCNFVN